MSITLTTKDADFILRFIRTDLEDVNKRSKEADESWERLNAACTDNIKDLPVITSMMKLAGIAKSESERNLTEVKAALEHCIELLTWGSKR